MQPRRFIPFDRFVVPAVVAGARPLLIGRVWYPVIEVQVVLRERSRGDMSELELAFLAVIAAGIEQAEDLHALLAVRERFADQLLDRLAALGLVEPADTGLRTTELGRLSLQEGALVKDVERALLVCGLTGQLLPREVHDLPRVPPQEAASKLLGRRLLEPRDGVPNRILSLRLDEMRDAGGREALARLGIPDEAIAIKSVGDGIGRFVEGGIVLAVDPGGGWWGELRLGSATALAMDGMLDLLVPEADVALAQVYDVRDLLAQALAGHGVAVRGAPTVSERQGIEARVTALTPPKPLTLLGRSWLSRLGTPDQPALPIWEFWTTGPDNHRRELLDGACLYLSTDEPALCRDAHALRIAGEAADRWYAKPRAKRAATVGTEVCDALVAASYEPGWVRNLAERHGDGQILRHLDEVELVES